MKKAKLCMIFVIVILLVSCKKDDVTISTFSHESNDKKVWETSVSYKRTLEVYHSDGIVSMMEITDEMVFPIGSEELIESCQAVDDITYEADVFQIDGLSYSSEVQDNSYKSILLLEYNKMDMKSLIESENWFINADEIVNEDLKVDYSKLENMIIEDGYKLLD